MTLTMRSRSMRSHGAASPGAGSHAVSRLPSLAWRPERPGDSLLALVGFSRPNLCHSPVAGAAENRL